MRPELTRDRLRALLEAIGRAAPRGGAYRVHIVGGGTAVDFGWRASTVDADLWADRDEVFHDIQRIKESLAVNVEFVRPEHFVPALPGSEERHVFVATFGRVTFYHHDPYAQVFAKLVRGFDRDREDAARFAAEGLVDPVRLRDLVRSLPDAAYARYPRISPATCRRVVDDFAAPAGP